MDTSHAGSAPPPADPRGGPGAARGAYFALSVVFGMNLLNYVDRYVFSSLGPALTSAAPRGLALSDRQFGTLGASFILVYTVASPVVGWLGDRFDRRRLMAFGVALWSLATVATAFARDYSHMFAARAVLGIGEASYGVVAPALLADLFARRSRGWVMGVYYLALPIGAAVGFAIGGIVEKRYNWQTAFWVVGVPGLLVAALGLLIRDPGRGASEGEIAEAAVVESPMAAYGRLFRTPSYLLNVGGMAAVTFTTGAFAHWAPIFYNRVRGMPSAVANLRIGVVMAGAGLLGIALATWGPDRLLRLTRRAYMIWAALAVMIAVPFGVMGLLAADPSRSMGLMFVAMVALAAVLGPCNAVTANVVSAGRRAAGFATSIFLIHVLGDIASPPLIGHLSEVFGRREVVASPIGRFLSSVGATPIGDKNLTAAMLLVIPVLLLGCVLFALGSTWLPRDQERATAEGASGIITNEN